MNWTRQISLFVILSQIFFLSSCKDDNQVYFDKMPLDKAWSHDEAISFYPEIASAQDSFDLILHYKHSKDYPFQNLYYLVEIKGPDELIQQDTLNMDLINRTGEWNGICGKSSCRVSTIFLKDHSFVKAGSQQISVYQYTREDSLGGIEEIALEIRKSQ